MEWQSCQNNPLVSRVGAIAWWVSLTSSVCWYIAPSGAWCNAEHEMKSFCFAHKQSSSCFSLGRAPVTFVITSEMDMLPLDILPSPSLSTDQTKEANFALLSSQSHALGHYSKIMAKSKDWNIDWLANWTMNLCSTSSSSQWFTIPALQQIHTHLLAIHMLLSWRRPWHTPSMEIHASSTHWSSQSKSAEDSRLNGQIPMSILTFKHAMEKSWNQEWRNVHHSSWIWGLTTT